MSIKSKTVWHCSECGHKQFKWAGQCPQCKQWNTISEEIELSTSHTRYAAEPLLGNEPVTLKEVSATETPRISTHIQEFDRLVGGGIVPGALTLIGGDPGIGKSTLMLQLSNALALQGLTVLYVCGEESTKQTSLRAKRLNIQTDQLLLLSETRFSHIKRHIDKVKPDLLIVDSIQIIYKEELPSAPGSVAQVRENANELMHIAKGQSIATFVIQIVCY